MYGEGLGEMAWMDLSVPDAQAVSAFYQNVLGWDREPMAMTLDNETYNDFIMTSAIKSDELSEVTGTDKDDSVNEGESENASSCLKSSSLVTGICHARGENKDMPAMWLPYFLVKDLDESIGKVVVYGGSLFTNIKNVGEDRYVVFKDPAGAMAAIYQKAEK
ncbi:VOC family protein [Colwellia psychrerythraea]|uniref:Glyoxalase-like domain containing protein n=1 Tax=Colwellia psychrerythraea TaxID=28229 RepID=A0A099KX54_COLPS|nr:VOC family protein [Colwellia psychrerythraea]KGJ95141.1 Glyoxalase-like domain containing protein [Colwellia psychrerythraea]